MTRCCVPQCSELGNHHFPKNKKLRRLWLKAIRRQEFNPTKYSRLCRKHFIDDDYEKVSKYTGVDNQHRYLKKDAIPSIFLWNTKAVSEQAKLRAERLNARNLRKNLSLDFPSTSFHNTQELDAETSHDTSHGRCSSAPKVNTCGTQTSNLLRLFSTDLLLSDNKTVLYYTGLETTAKFNLVLSTLLPMAYNIKYRWSRVVGLSIEDQFLILLIKLRINMPDFELSKKFGVSKMEVSNIIVTWIHFTNDIWKLIDMWPSRELINFYMPESFRKYYPGTRLIIDSTEIGIQKPSQPNSQKVSFSKCKHKNTLKFLVGASPGGLIMYNSDAYAGSISDRQIIERSNLLDICEPGDSIMADRGFNVQDLFAGRGVGINIPTFLKGKSQIPGLLLKQDQKLASQRVHIERLIGLTKTYKILTNELNHFYVPLASKILFICIMLCNFREGIVNKNI